MPTGKRFLLMLLFTACLAAWADPYIGYAYPAGGQQGSIIRVHIGGQRLGNVKAVLVSGGGVRGTIVSFEGAEGLLNGRQREFFRQRIDELIKASQPQAAPGAPTATPAAAPAEPPAPQIMLPDYPDLRDLERQTPQQLRQLAAKYLKQKQAKPPLLEDVIVELTIAPDAAPGDREIRLMTPGGVSNPQVFQVGTLPEVREKDRDVEHAVDPPPATAPVVLNGQILPGEVDRFTINMKAGQHLRFITQARHLVPFIADGVPGWCQAVIILQDADGKELGYADDTAIDPDPVMTVHIPRDGAYTLLVRDAIYRGREDFVYRVTVREQTADDTLYPMTPLATAPGFVPWVEDGMPRLTEIEPNDTPAAAPRVSLPALLAGGIDRPGDVDVFAFTGKAGDTVVAEVYARRLGSPMDALVRLCDAAGHVIAWNDDNTTGVMGLITQRTDAYLSVPLPADGVYTVRVSETQGHGGAAYRYTLRLSRPQPDFAVCVTPSAINVVAGGTVKVTAHALRRDGWGGSVAVVLLDAPAGFTLTNTRIEPGKDSVEMILQAPRKAVEEIITLNFMGIGLLNSQPVIRPALPADRLMQAFANYHLVPAQQLLVMADRK